MQLTSAAPENARGNEVQDKEADSFDNMSCTSPPKNMMGESPSRSVKTGSTDTAGPCSPDSAQAKTNDFAVTPQSLHFGFPMPDEDGAEEADEDGQLKQREAAAYCHRSVP